MPLDAPRPRSRKKKRLAGKVGLKRPLDAAAGKRGLERPLDAAGKRWTLQGGGLERPLRCRAALDAAGKGGGLLRGAGGRLGIVRNSWWLESTARRCSCSREAWAGKAIGRCREALDAAGGGLERPLRCRAALDAAGKGGRLLRGAGGSLGIVRNSWWLESTARRCSSAWARKRPLDAAGKRWTLQASVGGFWGGQAAVRNRKKELVPLDAPGPRSRKKKRLEWLKWTLQGMFRRPSSTPKVVPGAALPWLELGRVGGYSCVK